MAGVPANAHPRAFAGGDVDEQAAALAAVLEEVRPQVVVTYGPDGGYGHPDHIRAHDITMAACDKSGGVARVFHAVTSRQATDTGVAALARIEDLPYRLPAPGELPVTDDSRITTTVSIADVLSVKLRALRAHPTQVSVWQSADGALCYALSNGIAQPVPAAEFFVLAAGDPAGADTDLFGGM
jgi:N-acetyl-1-D-myo-inositol-2-amino-2-deoxy-alpha-D-glucopyranoside deacetylase